MRKLLSIGAIIASVSILACSKDNDSHLHPIDPVVSVIQGKWSFHSSSGINIPLNAPRNSPFFDTLIFLNDQYFIIDNKDTIDRGQYTLGQGKAINNGNMQLYDSILFKTAYITLSVVHPSVYYFDIKKDTLITSPVNYKGRFLTEKIIKYIRK